MPPYPGLPSPVLSPDELAAIALEVGWPAADVPQFVAIELNQDGGEGTVAFNPTDPYGGSIGYPQINGVHAPGEEMTPAFAAAMSDPVEADTEALSLFNASGWQPWTGDPSLGPQQTNLATGQQALADVQAVPPATLTSWYSDLGNLFKKEIGLAPYLLTPTSADTGTGVKAGVAAGNALSGVWADALKIAAGVVGAGLITLGLWKAATPEDKDGHPVLATAAKGALA